MPIAGRDRDARVSKTALDPRSVDLTEIKPSALVGIADQVVSAGDLFEFFFCLRIPGI